MKYSCKNLRTLENGITGALNFDLLKCQKMVPNQNFDMQRIEEKIATKYLCKNFITLENGDKKRFGYDLLKCRNNDPKSKFRFSFNFKLNLRKK
jgi:hypothetical protein